MMPRISDNILTIIAGMPPAYFAMVMATGIVSIASQLLGFDVIAVPLLWLNAFFYVVLWTLSIFRIGLYPQNFWSDFRSHERGPGYFTMIAGTCILGSQFVILQEAFELAIALWLVALALWFILVYGVFTALAVRAHKPLQQGSISGIWLVATVGAQSLSVLAGRLAPHFLAWAETLLLVGLCMFLIGGMLYLVIITLIFHRLLFLALPPQDVTPPYWINMGAAAITTLAGLTLVENGAGYSFVQAVRPFVLGFTLFFWAAASWWIPLLVLLGAWRYFVNRVKFTYSPQYWSVVFPLGMYTTCTAHLAGVTGMDWLMDIPRVFIWIALTAWAITFAGLIKSLFRSLSGPHQ